MLFISRKFNYVVFRSANCMAVMLLAETFAKQSCAMAEIINLRTQRKRAKRRHAELDAAAKRLAHGRTKAQRVLDKSQSDKADESLNGHRIETGDGQ
jgi:hypothetical protein